MGSKRRFSSEAWAMLIAITTGCLISIIHPCYMEDAWGYTIGAIILIKLFW